MVNGSEKLDKLFQQYLDNILMDRKRFELEDLESFFIKKMASINAYQSIGGYQSFYKLIKDKENSKEIMPIKSSPYNGRQPALKSRWQIIPGAVKGWQDQLIFKLSRQLDLRYYLMRPDLQTEELAGKLLKIAKFLDNVDSREWASREERSLELFADEKFLSTGSGKKLLNRLKLNLSDLKAEKYSQMFVYWKKGAAINKILILENHSAFISCKRALEAGYKIFSYDADTLIYGQGKHIIDSFKFLDELLTPGFISESQSHKNRSESHSESRSFNNVDSYLNNKLDHYKADDSQANNAIQGNNLQNIEIKYTGDMDPEGWLIYSGLKERYPAYNIELFTEYYQEMFKQANNKRYPINNKQNKNNEILSKIIREFDYKNIHNCNSKNDYRGNFNSKKNNIVAEIERLWKNNLRLPQELITYEVLTYG